MPKQAEALAEWKLPKTLPEGVTIAEMSRTVGKRPARPEGMSDEDYAALCEKDPGYVKDASIKVLRVEHTGEAVRGAIELLSKVGPGEQFGVEAAAVGLNKVLQDHVTRLEVGQIADALSFVPPLSEPRYVDPFEALTIRISAFQRDKGRMPTAAEYAKIYEEMQA